MRQRGFTLIEATITAGVLMIGVISLIHIARTSANQIADIRHSQGQPAIAERLIHDAVEAILAATPSAPATPQQVPPIAECADTAGGDCVTYDVSAVRNALCDGATGLACYEISVRLQGKAFTAGANVAPSIRIWRAP